MIKRAYGVSDTIIVSLVDSSTGQLLVSHTLEAGDVKVDIDGGGFTNITSLPSVDANGICEITLSIAELTGKKIIVKIVDQTDPKVFYDVVLVVETFGNASAQYPNDGIAMRGTDDAALSSDLTTVEGKIDVIDTNVDSTLSAVGALKDFDPDTETVTVGTNNDKTGYSISGTKQTLDALTDTTAQQVWEYTTRELTDKTGFALSDAGVDAILDEVMADIAAESEIDSDADITVRKALRALFNRFYREVTQTSTAQTVKNDSDTSIAVMASSDDGATQTKGGI